MNSIWKQLSLSVFYVGCLRNHHHSNLTHFNGPVKPSALMLQLQYMDFEKRKINVSSVIMIDAYDGYWNQQSVPYIYAMHKFRARYVSYQTLS